MMRSLQKKMMMMRSLQEKKKRSLQKKKKRSLQEKKREVSGRRIRIRVVFRRR